MSITTTIQPIPYLNFDGNCREAMNFYASVLNGRISSCLTGAESPIADELPKEFGDKILNAQLELPGGANIYGSDSMMPYHGMHGFGITLNFDTAAEGESIFNKLAEGGNITMPFEKTFWSDKFGMLTDKFGVNWMINAGLH